MRATAEELESYQLKKKLIPGTIDVHPTESAIIVNYTAQASILGEDGQPVVGDKKAGQKVIRIKQISPNSSITNLATEIVDKCKLIHPSRIAEVEQVLYYLQKRQVQDDSDRVWLKKQLDELKKPEEEEGIDMSTLIEPASMPKIDHYIEGLYEDIKEKIQATRSILELAKVPENMRQLIENESLMSALSRVLREDGRRSMELVTNIVYIFFCFSNFSEFHHVLTANKIGDLCLRIADQELKRFELWSADIKKFEEKAKTNDKTVLVQLENEHSKFQGMIKKQDQLLFVAFHVLLNLAEDLGIEVKMIKRSIVKYLIRMLDRSTEQLHILVITFLKKLSIFKENKDEMVLNADELYSKLEPLLNTTNKSLQSLIQRLCLNLSHDFKMREFMVKYRILDKLISLFNNQNVSVVTLQLIYQLSINDEHRSLPVFGDCIAPMIRTILEYKGERVNSEVMSIMINLSTVPKHQQTLLEDSGFRFLMKRAIKTKDPLLLKMLRNISQYPDQRLKMKFLDFIDEIMGLLKLETPEVTVELLGILGNLVIPEFDFAKLCTTYDLFSLIQSVLVPIKRGNDIKLSEDDDILLEFIILIGTMALDENIPSKIAQCNILPVLIDVMTKKQEDDEIVLQICYCVYQYLLHDVTCTFLIQKTQVVNLLIDLLYDRNIEIRKICDACLSVISEIDEEWEKKLRVQKFAWHNSEWISMITQSPTNMYKNDQKSHSRQSTGSIASSLAFNMQVM